MDARRIIVPAAAVVALAMASSHADVQQILDCDRSPAAAVAGINAETAEPLACEGTFTCPADSATSCELFHHGRLWGIGTIELSHSGLDMTCSKRGSQPHCVLTGTRTVAPGETTTWSCAAGIGTVAFRIEFECDANWVNAP